MEEQASYINITKKTNTPQHKYQNYYEERKKPKYQTEAKPGYGNDNELFDLNENTEKRKKPKAFGSLTENLEITGSDGKCYRIYLFLTLEQAESVKLKTGRILPSGQGKISGFLGAGAFSEVYVAEDLKTGEWFAVKIIRDRLEESELEASIQRELTQAIDPYKSHLMPLFDAVKKDGCLYYIMPLLALGDISALRPQLPSLKDEALKRLLHSHIALGLLLGLWQMHKQGIYHLDVKLANLLATREGKIAISDFGCSEKVEKKKENQALLVAKYDENTKRYIGNGDSTYFSPEREKAGSEDRPFDCIKSDIYSAGLALWELFTGIKVEDYREKNPDQSFLSHPEIKNASPYSLGDLIKHLIDPNPEMRWNLMQALNHPCLQDSDLHHKEGIEVVLDFLRRFVEQLQRENQETDLNQLAESRLRENTAVDLNSNEDQTERFVKNLHTQLENLSGLQEQLSLYLPLKGSLGRVGSDPFKLEEAVQKWLESDNAVLALLAEGGSGKSLSVQKFALQLLRNIEKVKQDEKPWLPLYVNLGSIKRPENLLQEAFGLNETQIKALHKKYRLVVIGDGYDEQASFTNLYVKNALHKQYIKLLVTCRPNAIGGNNQYFLPHVPEKKTTLGYEEIYVQPFDPENIQEYIQNYIKRHKENLEKEWQDQKYFIQKIEEIPGLKEFIQTPLMCRLVLEALPELSKRINNSANQKITRAEVYEAFLTQWIKQQQSKLTNPIKLEDAWKLGHDISCQLFESRSIEIDLSENKFIFDEQQGRYIKKLHAWQSFEEAKEKHYLPLPEIQKGKYKFLHFSLQEYLLARSLYQQLMFSPFSRSGEGWGEGKWNQYKLTVDEKDRPILYFLADWVKTDGGFKKKLFECIEQSKTDKTQARSAANAITALNAAGVQFNHKDFRYITIPDADLSGMSACETDFSHADLSRVNFQGAYLYGSNFNYAKLIDVRLGEYPSIEVKGKVQSICYSPNGRIIAVASKNNIMLYDARTRKVLRILKGHTEKVTSIHFSSDNQRIVSGSGGTANLFGKDNSVRVWDVNTGKLFATLKGHLDGVTSVYFSSDNQRIVSGGWDETVRVWDANTGELLTTMKGHSDHYGASVSALSVHFSSDDQRIVSGHMDGTGRVWETKSGKLLAALSGHGNNVRSIHFSSDGQRIVSGTASADNTIRVWDANTGKLFATLEGHTSSVNSVQFSPDNQRIVSGSKDKTVRLWEANSGKLLITLEGHTSGVNSVQFSPDNQRIVSGGNDKTVRVWDANARELLAALEGHAKDVTSVHFSSDNQRIVSGGWDKTVRVWDTNTGELLATLEGHTGGVESVYFSLDNQRIVSGSGDKTVRVWDAKSGKLLITLEGHMSGVNSVQFSPDNQHIVSGHVDGTVRVWDTKSGKLLITLKGHTSDVNSVQFSPDNQRIISGGWDETVQVWDANTGELLAALKGHKSFVNSVHFSSDNQRIVSGSNDKTVRVWNAHSGKLLATLEGHDEGVLSVHFSSDNQRIVSGSQDNTVRVWDVNRRKCLQVIPFPEAIRSTVWQRVEDEDRLVVGFGNDVAYYRLNADNTPTVKWVGTARNRLLVLTNTNITDVEGLSLDNADLFKQHGAIQRTEDRMQKTEKEKTKNPIKFAKNLFNKGKGFLQENQAETNLPDENENQNQQQSQTQASRFSKLPSISSSSSQQE